MAGDNPTNAPVTLSTIAREVGVSQSTVSAVLSRNAAKRRISPRTQQRILEIARRLNYRPNHLARGLRGRGTRTVGVLWSLSGPHPSESMARRIALLVQSKGYMAYLADSLNDPDLIVDQLADLARRGVEAMVMDASRRVVSVPSVRAGLAAFKSIVVVCREPLTGEPINAVHHDRAVAFAEVAEHFVRTGRRRPAILAGPGQTDKREAFLDRLDAAGLPRHEASAIELRAPKPVSMLAEASWRTLEAAFPGEVPFDALACSTDEGAMAAMSWLKGRGKRVPEDVAVVGFNDNVGSAFTDPPLASIARRDDVIATTIDRLLFRSLAEPELPPQHEHVPMTFVHRRSAG